MAGASADNEHHQLILHIHVGVAKRRGEKRQTVQWLQPLAAHPEDLSSAKAHTSSPLFDLIFCVFDACGCACQSQHVEVRGQPTGLSSFYHVDLGNQTQAWQPTSLTW